MDRTYWPNDKSAQAVRELAHAIRRNDLAAFVDGEGTARYDNDAGDRKVAAWKHLDLLNMIDDAEQEARSESGLDADTAVGALKRLKEKLEAKRS